MEDLFNITELNDAELDQVVGGTNHGSSNLLNALGGAVSGFLLNADNGNTYGGQSAHANQQAIGSLIALNIFVPINAFANRSNVVVVTSKYGFFQHRLTVLNDTLEARERLDILKPFASAISFTRSHTIRYSLFFPSVYY